MLEVELGQTAALAQLLGDPRQVVLAQETHQQGGDLPDGRRQFFYFILSEIYHF